jgi:excinuclease ABC subunit A
MKTIADSSCDQHSGKRSIGVFGARENNLKNVDVSIPKNAVVVITGPSGSGKSTLAFDVLHAEGQRRFLEGMSSYARSVLDIGGRADVDRIEGLSPTIAIDQKSVGRSPRSTVGTLSEIYDYLRSTFAQFGERMCDICGGLISGEVCARCASPAERFTAQHFSFNHPRGACPICGGLGERLAMDPARAITSERLTLEEGALGPLNRFFGRTDSPRSFWASLVRFARENAIDISRPLEDIPHRQRKLLWYSTAKDAKTFEGIFPFLERKHRETESDATRAEMERAMRREPCDACLGKRLRKESLAVRFDGSDIAEWADSSVDVVANRCRALIEASDAQTSRGVVLVASLREILLRAEAIGRVGVGYLSLSRTTMTISGGEAQRIRLAVQITSDLSGIAYVLDEPSMGLHPRDTKKLIETLQDLRNSGNTVIVVEHDRDIIESADAMVEIGPGAGEEGGEVLFSGSVQEAIQYKTHTAKYLSLPSAFPDRKRRILNDSKQIIVRGAREHNLKNIDVAIPLGVMTVIAGVSGSGKSTFVHLILSRELKRRLYRAKEKPGAFSSIAGVRYIDKVVTITQSAIGRSSRSNVATYTGIFSLVRELFAATPEAQRRKFDASRFSFNLKGGRCEECQGEGARKIEMYLLPDRFEPCEVCAGMRYNRETLAVRFGGATIADVLDMSVRHARKFFADCHPVLERKLETLERVGLGYIRLGQGAPDLSGGEAQRIKMAKELSRASAGKTLYLLDEPTVGLHFGDVEKLLKVLDDLVDRGNTVVMVEHNTDVIRRADWMIEFGPEGGENGGNIVFSGRPTQSKRCAKSKTGKFL